MEPLAVNIQSEIGQLEGVIVHLPGPEVENMTPENAERALYSDILNLAIALPEYNDFVGVLRKYTRVFEVGDLLNDILNDSVVKYNLVRKICSQEKHAEEDMCRVLEEMDNTELARKLIEGVEMRKDNLTRYLDDERYCLHPLPNFFFTRDASFSLGNDVMISRMANAVRERETTIMEAIFKHHPSFMAHTVNPVLMYDKTGKGSVEGGDVLVVRDDILLMGTGDRTSTQGVDALIEHLKGKPGVKHLVVQELPLKPESFIHLDMVFTFLDKNKVMIFEPLIIDATRYLTIHITIDGNKVVSIGEETNILTALQKLGMDVEPILCGGNDDQFIMEREQWQSGANFFTLEPGKIIGYERNIHTIENLNKHGFDVVTADDIVNDRTTFNDHKRMVITIEGNELSRGGGGARCMTMPVSRKPVNW